MNPYAKSLPTVQRVYKGKGKAAHLLHDWQSPNAHEPALCGVYPEYPARAGWMGTGTQDEYERAAELPICLNCERQRRRPPYLTDDDFEF